MLHIIFSMKNVNIFARHSIRILDLHKYGYCRFIQDSAGLYRTLQVYIQRWRQQCWCKHKTWQYWVTEVALRLYNAYNKPYRFYVGSNKKKKNRRMLTDNIDTIAFFGRYFFISICYELYINIKHLKTFFYRLLFW